MEKIKTNDKNPKKKRKEKNKNVINRKVKRNAGPIKNTKKSEKNIKINKDNEELKTQIPELKLLENLINNVNVLAYYQGKFICIFTSIDNILYLLYSKNNSIICYNLIDKKIMIIINNAHPDYIRNFSHYLDKKDNRDLLMSISAQNLKVWNFNNWENILSIDISYRVRKKFYIGCFINENDNINILTIYKSYSQNGNFNFFKTINILNLYGNNIKNIEQDDEIIYINCYNKKFSKNYVILCHLNKIQSYDYKNNKIYNIYNRSEIYNRDIFEYVNIIINDNERLIKIIASNYKFIEIWNFDSGILINKINIKEKIYSMGLWNNKFLFVGCTGNIQLIDYEKGKIMENKIIKVKGTLPRITYIEKYKNPLYGECLLSICGSLIKIYK